MAKKKTDIQKMLDITGLPYVREKWKSEMPIPCIVYRQPTTSNIGADGKVIMRLPEWKVELYTKQVDEILELKVCNAFGELFWEKTDAQWIDEEQMFVTYFDLGTL